MGGREDKGAFSLAGESSAFLDQFDSKELSF